MTCKYIYIGQKWTSSDLKFGKGSIYLAGPRNRKGKSWRIEAINKIASAGVEASLFIPESVNQLKGGFCRISKEEKSKWQKFAIASATSIIFWYPKDESEDVGATDLKAWCKSDKVFVGKDPENQSADMLSLLAGDTRVNISGTMDELVERLVNWLR